MILSHLHFDDPAKLFSILYDDDEVYQRMPPILTELMSADHKFYETYKRHDLRVVSFGGAICIRRGENRV